MRVLENQTLENESVVMEDTILIKCVLKNCHIVYSGGDYEWKDVSLQGTCQFHFRDAAGRAQNLFRMLGLMKEQNQIHLPAAVNTMIH